MIDITMDNSQLVNIKVIGVGGAGGNAINRMMESKIEGVEYVAINTDAQALRISNAEIKIQIGESGLGAGSDPAVAHKAAEKSKDEILKSIEGAHMVFITAGMGGGTGSGAAPFIAKIAKESGALTVGVVTMPFRHEMRSRSRIATEGLESLEKEVDTIIVIKNERINLISKEDESVDLAFKRSDEVLMDCVNSVVQVIVSTGMVNTDFADVVTVMKDKGRAHMGIGRASGNNRAEEATKEAFVSPLLDHSIAGCKYCLVSVMGSKDGLKMSEYNTIGHAVEQIADKEALVISGIAYSESLNDDIMVTVIASGFEEASNAELKNTKLDKEVYGAEKSAEQTAKSTLANNDFESLFSSSDKKIDLSDSYTEKEKNKNTDNLEVPDFLKM